MSDKIEKIKKAIEAEGLDIKEFIAAATYNDRSINFASENCETCEKGCPDGCKEACINGGRQS